MCGSYSKHDLECYSCSYMYMLTMHTYSKTKSLLNLPVYSIYCIYKWLDLDHVSRCMFWEILCHYAIMKFFIQPSTYSISKAGDSMTIYKESSQSQSKDFKCFAQQIDGLISRVIVIIFSLRPSCLTITIEPTFQKLSRRKLTSFSRILMDRTCVDVHIYVCSFWNLY